MGYRRRIVLAVALVAMIAVLVLLSAPSREPEYQGKPLSVWLAGYNVKGDLREVSDARIHADTAVRSVGTNAIPILLNMIRTRDSSLKTKVIDLLNKSHIVKINSPTAESQTYPAAMAFRTLGPVASNAIPVLVQTYQDNYSFVSQRDCLYALGALGPAVSNAVPNVLEIAFDTNKLTRLQAIHTLGDIHVRLDLTVPALIRLLGETDKNVRRGAAQSLGNLGPDAKPAVPALIQALKDPDPVVIRWSKDALLAVDPETAAKAMTNASPAIK